MYPPPLLTPFLFKKCLCNCQIPFLAERTDLVALLDEFASRFFDELDYVKECANGLAIKEDMKDIKQVTIFFLNEYYYYYYYCRICIYYYHYYLKLIYFQ